MLVLKPVVFFQDLSKGGSGPSINPFSTLIQLNSQGQHWKHRCPDLLLHSHLQLTQKSPQTSPKTQSLPVRHSHSSLTYRQDPKILGIPPHKSASPPQPNIVCTIFYSCYTCHPSPLHTHLQTAPVQAGSQLKPTRTNHHHYQDHIDDTEDVILPL